MKILQIFGAVVAVHLLFIQPVQDQRPCIARFQLISFRISRWLLSQLLIFQITIRRHIQRRWQNIRIVESSCNRTSFWSFGKINIFGLHFCFDAVIFRFQQFFFPLLHFPIQSQVPFTNDSRLIALTFKQGSHRRTVFFNQRAAIPPQYTYWQTASPRITPRE